MKWQDRRLLDLFGIDHPILQAPMAGASSTPMAIAVSEAGGLGAVAAAMLTPETLRTELQLVQQATARSINLNFFVHKPPVADAAREAGWRKRLAPYYRELGLSDDAGAGGPVRAPFDAALCDVVLEYKPRVVSFHFGLPDAALVQRLKATSSSEVTRAICRVPSTPFSQAPWYALPAHLCRFRVRSMRWRCFPEPLRCPGNPINRNNLQDSSRPAGPGILTRFPSTTALALVLGAGSPCVD